MAEPSAPIDALREVCAQAPRELVAAYLYGSRARGTATAASDLDLGLLFAEAPRPALKSLERRIEDELERLVRVRVEAVVLNTAPPDLLHRVLRDGVLLLDRDRPARLRFEVQARNEFFDMAPIRKLYRRMPA